MTLLDRTAAGFVQLYPSFSSVALRRLWILNDLFVGKALMERARQLAIATGAKGLALSTEIENASAQTLYEKLGSVRDTGFHHYSLAT